MVASRLTFKALDCGSAQASEAGARALRVRARTATPWSSGVQALARRTIASADRADSACVPSSARQIRPRTSRRRASVALELKHCNLGCMQASTGPQHAAPACVGSPKEGSLGLVPSSKIVLGLCMNGPRLVEGKGGRRPPRKCAQGGDARAPKYSGFSTASPLRGAPAAAADARALLLGRGRLGGCYAFAFAAGLPRSICLPLQWPSGVPRRCGVPGCQPCKAGVGGGDMVVVAFAPQRVRPGWVSALCGSAPVNSFQAAGTCCCC